MSDDDREEEKEGDDLKNNTGGFENKEDAILPDESVSATIKSLEQEIDERKKEYNELHERYLRVAADFDNYRKRVSKEKADIIAYANEELIKALLNVLDNLERALEHSESSEDPGPIVEGVKLVYKHFLSCLEKFGVQPVDASKGQEFDPRCHQAIERVESSDITPGIILSEMLKGYTLKDRLLRPALVVVSKEQKGVSEGKNAAGNSDEDLNLIDEENN
jgi:molecular chaperone GrpE